MGKGRREKSQKIVEESQKFQKSEGKQIIGGKESLYDKESEGGK